MDFRSRLATFSRGVPVHELNEDDYANNVKLSSTNGVEKTRSKKRKQALRNQVEFSLSGLAVMAPSDNLNNQSKGKSAKSTSKINKKTDFELKKQKLSDLRKGKISKPKSATAKVITFLPRISTIQNSVYHETSCTRWKLLILLKSCCTGSW
jgi:hypothetical protein